MNSKKKHNRRNQNQLRIIGGKWRGRKLSFPDATGLRPTGDRIRETVFNWLTPFIEGANVADLYAGSGILGFESASRLAKQVSLVEKNITVANHLRNTITLLNASESTLHNTTAVNFLNNWTGDAFDIIFIDPPFGQNLIPLTVTALAQPGILSKGSIIYVETPAHEPPPQLPNNWQVFKQKLAGNVSYRLFITD